MFIQRALLSLMLLLSARSLAGCGCTAVGCSDGTSVTITSESGMFPPGIYTVTATGDEGQEECFFVLEDQGSGVVVTDFSTICQPPSLDGAVLTIMVPIVSDGVTVDVRRDKTLLGTQSFTPEYGTSEPNGALCGPTCHAASVAMTIQ